MPCDRFNLFVCNIKKPIAGCISAKENYFNLTKNRGKFQASATERCTSLSKHFRMFWQNLLKLLVKRFGL